MGIVKDEKSVDIVAESLVARFYGKIRPLELLLEQKTEEISVLVTERQRLEREIIEVTASNKLLQEHVAEFTKRPAAHTHDPDEPNPVLTFDLDGTLKPQVDRGDGGNYPLIDEDSTPFPDVKKWLDRWKARKACIHVATAGLHYYSNPNDLEVYHARLEQLQGWANRWGLPVDIFLPKVGVDVHYDDRMITVPGDPALKKEEVQKSIPDWNEIGSQAETAMVKRFSLDNGIWTRVPKNRIGDEIEDWPGPEDYPRDFPRGYSGPKIDVDMHRTLSEASSSLRTGSVRPGAIDVLNKLYGMGVTILISCAGWNPMTHDRQDAMRRLWAIRKWLQENSVPYDRIVTKDHADLYFDDKGIRHTNWETDLPLILKKLPISESYTHGD
jgi:hypothetical protein